MAGLNRFEVAKKKDLLLRLGFLPVMPAAFLESLQQVDLRSGQRSGSNDLGISSLSSLVQWIGGAAEQGLLRFVYASKT